MTKWRLKEVHEALAAYIAKGEGDPERAWVAIDDRYKNLESELRTLDIVKKIVEGMMEELAK